MKLEIRKKELYVIGGTVCLGDVLVDVDGEYKFFPNCNNGGYWSPEFMRAIADKMDELNKPLHDMIANDPQVNGQLGVAIEED